MIKKHQDSGKVYSGKSIAQQLLQNTKLGKLLWGDNTYTDGYGTTRTDAPLKESANGQELQRMKETAKDAAKLTATGLAFANPVTASKVMAPLIVGSQAYWIETGFKDGVERTHIMLEDPSQRTAQNAVMLGLDFMPAPTIAKQTMSGAKEVVPALKSTGKLLWNIGKAAPKNIKGFITTGTKAGRLKLQNIADETYASMKARVPEIANEAGIQIKPQSQKLKKAGFSPSDIIEGVAPDGKNLIVYVDFSNPNAAKTFGEKPINSKINYIFDLKQTRNGQAVPQVGHSNANGVTINRAHFLFPYKDSAGNWQMLNVTGMKGTPEFIVGHESLHRAMNGYTPIKGDNRLRFVWSKNPYYDPLKAWEGTHNGRLEEWRADVSGMFAEKGIPQNTRWTDLSNDVQTDIIKSIAQGRGVDENDVRSIVTGLSLTKFLKNGYKLN